jgi:hypothetical protein
MSRRQNTREFDRQKTREIAEKLGLDPDMDLVVMYQGTPYIRANGVYAVAIKSGVFEGCEIEVLLNDVSKHHYMVRARVWIKGKKMPFEALGDANPENSPNRTIKGTTLLRIAETRAKMRAMRTALDIGIYSVDEMDEDFFREGQQAPPATATSKRPRTPQKDAETYSYPHDRWKRAVSSFASAYREQGYDQAEAQFILRRNTGKESTKDCTDIELFKLASDLVGGLTDQEQAWLAEMAESFHTNGKQDAEAILGIARKNRPQVEVQIRRMLATLDHQEAEQEEIGQKKAA